MQVIHECVFLFAPLRSAATLTPKWTQLDKIYANKKMIIVDHN